MLRYVLRGLRRNSSGLTLIAGAIGVLTGVERLMSTRVKTIVREVPRPEPVLETAVPRTDYFKISRTQSELGYTYWVLQGFGRFRSFALFDTWQEAVEEAARRTECREVRQEEFARSSV